MKKIELYTHLTEVLLKRMDTYIAGINSKASFMIAFNTFILGGIVLKSSDISASFVNPKIVTAIPFIIFIIFIGGLISLIYAFKATMPYLKTGNRPSTYHSYVFFGSIAEMHEDDFIKNLNNQSDDSIIEDLTRQAYCLAQGANKKHIAMRHSMLAVSFLVLVPIALMSALKVLEFYLK